MERLAIGCIGISGAKRASGCQYAIEVDLPVTKEAISVACEKVGWYLSIVSPPGRDPVVQTAICHACAVHVYPRHFLAEIDRKRKAKRGH